jgi:membrane protease YdiL (CAAX protease family)
MRWSVGQPQRIAHAMALIAARVVLVFLVGMGLLARLVAEGDGFGADGKSVALVLFLLLPIDAGLVLAFGLLKVGRCSLHELGWHIERFGRDVAAGLVGFVLAAGVLVTAQTLLGASLEEQWGALREPSLVARLLFCCVAVFGAALVEESLFRGYLQPALVARFGLPGAVVLQAIVFDLMHLNFAPASLVVKFLFGVIFGALRGRDGSLLAPAIAHGLIWVVFGA